MLAYLGWMRRYRFRVCLDVRRYFATINHDLLYELFAQRLRDPRTLALLRALLEAGGRVYHRPLAKRILGLADDPLPPGCGLPLGGHLSHWSGGLYLDGLDHYVKRVLKVPGYLRYMDDTGLFGNDPCALEDQCQAISAWVREHRGLELEPRRDGVRTTRQPSAFLGHVVSRNGLQPGRKARQRLRQRLARVDEIGTRQLARSLRAYRGVMTTIG